MPNHSGLNGFYHGSFGFCLAGLFFHEIALGYARSAEGFPENKKTFMDCENSPGQMPLPGSQPTESNHY